MNKKLDLFVTFFKIGAFTFGGGYAMVPLIKSEAADKKGWIREEDMLDILAIAESTPGPIAINSATFVGYKTAGVWGSLCATLGVVLPSFVIIALLGTLLDRFSGLKPVRYAFFGIRAGVLALILKALWSMYRQTKKNVLSYIIMAAAFICVAILNINTIFVLIGCAIFGLVWSLIAERRAKNDLS